jgi:hypothetical protein
MALTALLFCSQARPGHPVFLDAIGRTLRKTEEIMEQEREAKAKGEVYMPDSALGMSMVLPSPSSSLY